MRKALIAEGDKTCHRGRFPTQRPRKASPQIRSEGYAVQSVRRKLATLRVFMGFWVRRGVLHNSPFWRIRMDFGRERRLPRSLTGPDTKKLVETAWAKLVSIETKHRPTSSRSFLARRNVAIVEILFATGMRVGELVALNFGSGTVTMDVLW